MGSKIIMWVLCVGGLLFAGLTLKMWLNSDKYWLLGAIIALICGLGALGTKKLEEISKKSEKFSCRFCQEELI